MSFLSDLEKLLESEGELTPEIVCTIISTQWGGERVYVTKQADVLRATMTRRDTVKTLMARGVKRSTAYNWVSKWK